MLEDAHTSSQNSSAYSTYGIGDNGAFVAVRPDGYVGLTAPLDGGVQSVMKYLAGFLNPINAVGLT